MNVTLFARVNLAKNPYILLYKKALEDQGIQVFLEPEFGLKWMVSRSKSCDAIHLHWIEASYKIPDRNVLTSPFKKFIRNRYYRGFRGILRLADFVGAILLAKSQRKIIVYTVHNLTPHYQHIWLFKTLNRIAHHVVFALSSHIHAHNNYTLKSLESTYERTACVRVIPHGNYIGCYPNQVSQPEARRQLGLPEDAFIYLLLGQLRPYKGLDELIDAFHKLGSPTVRLLIAGRVSKARHREELLKLIDNNPAISLIPEFIPDESIQLYLNACNICVLPYRDITTSGAAMLALSFGRPLIAPAVASFPEIITPTTGILYDPSQPKALLSALQQARQHSWSRSKILDYAHQFDWSRLGPQLAALYQADSNQRR